jgi:hypothetical protein
MTYEDPLLSSEEDGSGGDKPSTYVALDEDGKVTRGNRFSRKALFGGVFIVAIIGAAIAACVVIILHHHSSSSSSATPVSGGKWDGKSNTADCICTNDNPIQSWHVHVLYIENAKKLIFNDNPHNEVGALALQADFTSEFGTPDCDQNEAFAFNQTELCSLGIGTPGEYPIGQPFFTPTVSWFVPLDRFEDVVPWILHNRRNYTVLVNPNTCGYTCSAEDHLDWGTWAGHVTTLRFPNEVKRL